MTEAIGATTPAGRMVRTVGLCEFECAMLRERTEAGLDAARQDGRTGVRRPKLLPQQQAEITRMVSKGGKTAADAARLVKIHPVIISWLPAREPRFKTSYAKQRRKNHAK